MSLIKSETKSPEFDRLSLFCFLWAVAAFFHSISFPEDIALSNPLSWLDGLAALAVIFFPRAVYLFLLLLVFRIGHVFQWMPYAPNHILFELILNIGILIAFLWVLFARSKSKSSLSFKDPLLRKDFFNAFAPFTRVSLLLLYFFAVLHKLNWDYLNPAISCGTFLLEGLITKRLTFLPNNEWVHLSGVWGTLAVEAGIPLMLCFKRTRYIGIYLGLGFHYLLAIHPHRGIYSFSSMLFALYFLFTPVDFVYHINQLVKNFLWKWWSSMQPWLKALFVGILLSAIIFALINWSHKIYVAGFLYWSAWGALVILVYTYIIVFPQKPMAREVAGEKNIFTIRQQWLWLIPIVIFLNGFSPYLGLKTETSFSMFSNLRTEGGVTNHLFIPVSLQIAHYQKDLVEIIETDYEALEKLHLDDQYTTFFEFHRVISESDEDLYVKYARNGEEDSLAIKEGVSTHTDFTAGHPWLISKTMFFRSIDKGPCLCKH